MIEPASAWLARNPTGVVGLIVGGEPLTFVDWIIGTIQSKAMMVATNSDAGKVQARLVLDTQQAISVRVSRGIERDIEDAIRERASRYIIFTGPVTLQFFATKSKTLGQRLSTLTGYDHPGTIIEDMARQRLMSVLETYAGQMLPTILLHDPVSQLATVEADFVYIAQMADTPATSKPDLPNPDPPIGAVLEHIEFLARTEQNVADQMHFFLKLHPLQTLFDYWRAQFERDDVPVGYETMRTLAMEQLARLETNIIGNANR
jgi:hypothetical protein